MHPLSRQITPDERAMARSGPWWWSLADNPPCLPWCEVVHDPDEFRDGGGMHCYRFWPVSGEGRYVVELSGYQAGNPEMPFAMEPADLRIGVSRHIPGRVHTVEDLDVEATRELAHLLEAAAAFLAEVRG